LVDLSVTRWYDSVMRYVRKAFLLGEGVLNRKERPEEAISDRLFSDSQIAARPPARAKL
jgi:hypothetical protein